MRISKGVKRHDEIDQAIEKLGKLVYQYNEVNSSKEEG